MCNTTPDATSSYALGWRFDADEDVECCASSSSEWSICSNISSSSGSGYAPRDMTHLAKSKTLESIGDVLSFTAADVCFEWYHRVCSSSEAGSDFKDHARFGREGFAAYCRAEEGCGPMPQRLPDGRFVIARFWGITWTQIEDLYECCRADARWDARDSASDLVRKFVTPKTADSQMGLALTLNQKCPLEVTLMVSHAWAENAETFLKDLLQHMAPHEVAFVCFLSNYQGTPEEIDAQLGNNIYESPFTTVINNASCTRLLVVPNEELRENGQGLYSRLWCDWEIKVAADAGLPIHIVPKKDSVDYLLGCGKCSSRDARCGDHLHSMNKDERMIRKAIETMPVQTTRANAVGVFVVSLCAALGPAIAYGKWQTPLSWAFGFFIGGGVGFFFLACILSHARAALAHCRQRDGYTCLDRVIKGAAKGAYAYRRFRPREDLPSIVLLSLVCGASDAAWRALMFEQWDKAWWCDTLKVTALFAGWLEGYGVSILLWIVLNINKVGPWTGVFFIRPKSRFMWSGVVACLTILGGLVGNCIIVAEKRRLTAIGRGALIGNLFGLGTISASHARWVNLFGLLLTISLMLLTFIINGWMWRSTAMLSAGMCVLQHSPDWRICARVGLIWVAAISMVLLQILGLQFPILAREVM